MWRAIVLAICAAGAFLAVAEVADQAGIGGAPPWFGVWGCYFGGSGEPFYFKVLTVDPGGPSDRAGLRGGDLVDIRSQALRERFYSIGQAMNARPMTLSVLRGSSLLKITVVPGPLDFKRFWNYAFMAWGSFWLLIFSALIAWRRPYVGGNLLLSTVLAFFAIGTLTSPVDYAWPWTWPYVVLGALNQMGPLSIAAWATYASSFARPLSRNRRIALGACYATVAVLSIIGNGTPGFSVGAAPFVATMTLWFDPAFFFGARWIVLGAAAVLCAMLSSALAIGASSGVDRQRAAWALVPLVALYFTNQFLLLSLQFFSYATTLIVAYAWSVLLFTMPLALTYAALRRRLFDIGFVLNRAAVFAVVSTIVIGAFILVEWAASEWFVNASHATSALIGMIVALALGVSMRYIHRFVDRFVDRVFFHKRHEDEAALRRYAHESSYVTDRRTLLERTVQNVCDHTDAQDVAVLVLSNRSYVSAAGMNGARLTVDENDPAILALRAWHKPIELHDFSQTALHGDLAFPMVSRGTLMGVLVCGQKRDGEAYAPDESSALLALAHGVGTALD
ncbi:MAG: hypothetical protein M3N13_06210, partial [Candidatus Eremiobacteraeota bacterium]|nr:hypothetical protein [Candidatus Eremiobacteraeota bacterium]